MIHLILMNLVMNFNTDGSLDTTVNSSLKSTDFQEYTYSIGIKDDGVGETLESLHNL